VPEGVLSFLHLVENIRDQDVVLSPTALLIIEQFGFTSEDRLEIFDLFGPIESQLDVLRHVKKRFVVLDLFLYLDATKTAFKECWVLQLRHYDTVFCTPVGEATALVIVLLAFYLPIHLRDDALCVSFCIRSLLLFCRWCSVHCWVLSLLLFRSVFSDLFVIQILTLFNHSLGYFSRLF